jgi:glutamyl-tRNA reductase
VAAGLDSAILAETEIQAQVKIAYATATRFSLLPSCMHYIFQKALKIGKLVRSQMSMELAPSLFQVIWQIASGHLTDLTKARILLVGNSEINRRMAHFLRQRKIDRFTWITQHPSNSLDGCEVFGYEAIDTWPQYDWIICASAQDRFLIHGESSLRHAIFDLSVPRNVDPKLEESKGVLLVNIEQINQWIQQAKSKNSGQMTILNEIIRRETTRLAQIYWQKTQYSRIQYAQGILGRE